MTPPDILTPTENGADVRRSCGCVERLNPDWDAWVLLQLCPDHTVSSASLDARLPDLLGRESDHYVVEAAGGKRVRGLRPKDETK